MLGVSRRIVEARDNTVLSRYSERTFCTDVLRSINLIRLPRADSSRCFGLACARLLRRLRLRFRWRWLARCAPFLEGVKMRLHTISERLITVGSVHLVRTIFTAPVIVTYQPIHSPTVLMKDMCDIDSCVLFRLLIAC